MAKSCKACEDLRQYAPDFTQNGVTDSVCASLKNNTGLNPSNSRNNCTDLDAVNDCLIGNMEEEVDAYEVCDWKVFTKNLINNIWTTLDAFNCAMCGTWSKIASILKEIDKIWCWLENLTKNTGGVLHAYEDDDPSKPAINGFRIAKGVKARTGANSAPLNITVIGSTARVTGSLTFDGVMPTSYTGNSTTRWLDFDRDGDQITNTKGRSSVKGNAPSGGLFVYEYQVNPCDYGFKDLANANLASGEAGNFQFRISTYKKGDEYPYDYGWDENGKGQIYNPSDENKMLIQVRLINMNTWGIAKNTGRVTPNGVTLAVPCRDSWDC